MTGSEEDEREEPAQGCLAYYAPVTPENKLKWGGEFQKRVQLNRYNLLKN